MKEKLFFISLILAITLVSSVYAEDQIPKAVLDQWTLDPGYYTSKNDSCTINAYVSYCHSSDKKLTDWRLSSKEQAEIIAENFIKNRQDITLVSSNDLKTEETIFSAQPDYDHYNPTATVVYKQYYHEIPVFEAQLRISINAYGTIWSVRRKNILADVTAPTTPVITSDGSIKIAKERYNQAGFESEKDPELLIYENRLVWRLNILAPIFKEVMIDSQNGEIVLERKNVRDETSIDTGIQKTDNVPLTQKQTTNIYYYLLPIIVILAILAYLILRKKR